LCRWPFVLRNARKVPILKPTPYRCVSDLILADRTQWADA